MDTCPHGRNLRKGRVSIHNQIYFITTSTRNRRPVFQNLYAARELILLLKYHEKQNQCHTLAFVVMPDHMHWLLQLSSTIPLSKIINLVKGQAANRINHLAGRHNQPLWQRGFYDHALRREEDIQTVARYIVANPLRAGLVERIGDYPHWDAIWL